MPRKKQIPNRFSVRLTKGNAVLVQGLLDYEPTVSTRNQAINHALERYFMYVRYQNLILALEGLFRLRSNQELRSPC